MRAWQRNAQQLRAALAGLPDLPDNRSLDPVRILERRKRRARMQWAVAAAWVLALGLGLFGGWQVRGWREARLERR